ncbi:MAG: hypothetical protein Q3963_06735 [Coriobacteriaceae bacterium]|nr:hypothetical protein [Coriobacteriaceae bacterium]
MSDSEELIRINELEELATLSPGMFVPVDSNQYGTVRFDIGTFVASVQGRGLVWDSENGWYTNESVAAWLAARRDGLAYGVSVPKGNTTACTKTGANAGIAAPTPGWVGHPSVDPYQGRRPFLHVAVNTIVDADGTQHIKGIEGDGRFRLNGTNGDVCEMTPVLWWSCDESGNDAVEISLSDCRLPGLTAQPQAYLPDGSLRPYMLYAKYIGVQGTDGKMHSYSGFKPWNRSVSHNSLITQCATATTGYSGKSYADDWYVKMMFLMKYGTKNSQSVFAGCTNYNYQMAPSVAESGKTRVIVSNANAANLVVGSAMMFGTHTGNNDRNTASNYDIFDGVRILSITDYDANNKCVNFDTATTFNTATTYLLSTSPWFSGALDAVEGDGTLTSAGRTNGKEPFKLQGIECSVGVWEILGDVIIKSDGSTGWKVYVNRDSRNESTGVTANYTDTGKALASGTSDAWHYPFYPTSAGGLLCGAGDGASTSTGMCDGQYTNKTETSGEREWRGVGYLNVGAIAGLWAASGSVGLGSADWSFGSRLSCNGRGRAAA